MDWGTGEYEHTASQLAPAATVVVERLAPTAHERVVDLGCGTGNATLLVADRGAEVLGVDPSPRLLRVAAERAAAADVEATFAEGTAANLPAEDGSLDAVVSVFGLIFAPDPEAAAAEIGRALRPGGRLVYSAWIPDGAIAAGMGLRRAAMADLEPAGPSPFPWHELDPVRELLSPFAGSVDLDRHDLAFTADSPAAYVDDQLRTHPLWLGTREALEPMGRWDPLVAQLHEHFASANEDPSAFRVSSAYVVVEARTAESPG